MRDKYWQHFEHEADVGIRGVATTLADAFEQAALALSAVITDLGCISATNIVNIECAAADEELLLVDWLNAIIFDMSTRKMLFSKFDVSITNLHLKATLYGEKLDISKHQPVVEIKGATYTALSVKHDVDRWVVECVVDV